MKRQCMLVRGVTGDYGILMLNSEVSSILSFDDNLKKSEAELLFVNPTHLPNDSRAAILFLSSWTGADCIANFTKNHSFYAVPSLNTSGFKTSKGVLRPFGFRVSDFDDELQFGEALDQWIDNNLGFTDPQRSRLELLFENMKKYEEEPEDDASVSVILQSKSDGV